jgi:hypothetical protein
LNGPPKSVAIKTPKIVPKAQAVAIADGLLSPMEFKPRFM